MIGGTGRGDGMRKFAAVVMVGALTLLVAGAAGQFLGWF